MPARVGLAILIAAMLMGTASAAEVDETALREYAALKRTDRVAAETRRLRKLYPNWTAPSDLWTARASGPDEAPLWDLYEAGNLVQLKKDIADRQAREAGWRPSADLTRKIAARELRTSVMAEAAKANWGEVARLVGDSRLLRETDDINLSWIAAEALTRTGRAEDGAAIYRQLLERSNSARDRVATVQKALTTLPIAEVEKLIAAQSADRRGDFDAIGIDITRARMNAFLRGETSAAVEPMQQSAFEDFVRQSADPQQAGLMAWYVFRRGQYDKALEWFKWSIARGGDAMIAHGLALTLNRLGFRKEAEDVAYAWLDHAPGNAILFIDALETQLTRDNAAPLDPARIGRYAQVTLNLQSGEGAQALAWYSYNACQFETALEWFQHAAAWYPKEATIYGYALTLQRLKRQREFLDIVNRYDGLFPSVVGLLFKDESIRAPSACDRQAAASVVAVNLEGGAYARPNADGRGNAGPSVPRPGALTGFADTPMQMQQPSRAEFPLPAAPENPLRFGLPGASSNIAQAFRRENRFDRPLIARRVPGAAPMPYERLNIALLPGWNGVIAANYPPASARAAAAGTVAAQDAAAERDTPNKATAERPIFSTNRFHP